MLGNRKFIIDTMSEVYNIMKPYSDDEFWDLGLHETQSNSIYLLGRKQMVEHTDRVRTMTQDPTITVIFGNSAEGSKTILDQLHVLKIEDLVLSGQLLLLTGGEMESRYPYLLHEHFITHILDYDENIQAQQRTDEIFTKHNKPYKFLFLNGRARSHRKYLLERFRQMNLLDHALWTLLDGRGGGSRHFTLTEHRQDLLGKTASIKHLPSEYEFESFKDNSIVLDYPHKFAKNELFGSKWGEIYLEPAPYIDTYFSLVTETVFEYPYSFRTEKIAKPLAMGHPWICATSVGFYRDIHKLGFQTFGHVIDESFDSIDNHQDRMERIAMIVDDLCQQDLASFLNECYNVCKYNQQHLAELRTQCRKEFPDRFQQFINERFRF
jgi:hypothetical protein